MDWKYRFNKQSAFQEKMWTKEAEWQESMWNKQNEYNLPVNQMQRAMDAGINPNNIVGGMNDVAAAGSVGGAPGVPSAPDPSMSDYGASLSAIKGLGDTMMDISKYLDSERDNIQANTENIKQNTAATAVNMKKTNEEIRGLIFDNDILKQAQKDQMYSVVKKNLSDVQLNDQQVDEIKEKILTYQKQRAEIDKQISYMDEQIALTKEKIDTEQSIQGKNAAETQLANLQAQKTDAEKRGQELFNNYEKELQGYGQSTYNSGNAAINASNVALVNSQRAAQGSNQNKADYSKSVSNATDAATRFSTGPQKWQNKSANKRHDTHKNPNFR